MRHWIIGSGPSLRHTPLHLLNGEITWGMNRIHLIYPRTEWRPTYYLMVDFNQQNPQGYWRECIDQHLTTHKYLWDGFRNGHRGYPDLGSGVGDLPNTTWIPRCQEHHYYMADNYVHRAESWHLPDICTAFSGIGSMMQLAVQQGATELCLLGCDAGYTADTRKNHFVEEYTGDFRDRADLDNQNMHQVHTVARRSSPIPIYDCTVDGKLNVHPKRDMLEVLGA